MSRAQRHRERADAARRLSAVAARVPDGGTAWTPGGPDGTDGTDGTDGGSFGWFAPPDPRDTAQTSAPPERSGRRDPGSLTSRWREAAADRMPLALRGASGLPLTGVVAVVLVLLAVGCGAVLRSMSAGAQVVQVAGPRASTAVPSAPPSHPAPGSPPVPVGSLPSSPVPSTSAQASSTSGPGVPASSADVLVVDVVGRVRRPGLVRLPPGSRVADAVAAAGGATDAAVLARINLARPLSDGEQVLVPDADDVVPSGPAVSSPGATASAGAAAGPLDLNVATAADLEELPGIGPVLAGRIVQWRVEHGRFASVDELTEVSGIGPTVLERLRPLVRV